MFSNIVASFMFQGCLNGTLHENSEAALETSWTPENSPRPFSEEIKCQWAVPTFENSPVQIFFFFTRVQTAHTFYSHFSLALSSEVSVVFRIYFTDIRFGVSTQTTNIYSWKPVFTSIRNWSGRSGGVVVRLYVKTTGDKHQTMNDHSYLFTVELFLSLSKPV